jgi:2-polyprenyl-6-hydroxyphenyl methylase/3-demethylubiquinone-9 3-methyltransferase
MTEAAAKAAAKPAPSASGTVDEAEIRHFSALADQWWDEKGKFRTLHKFNPVRLQFLRDAICRHFGRDPDRSDSMAGLSLVDIGCGGGLLSEPFARLGTAVTGIDAAARNVEVAKIHAGRVGLAIDYRATTAEALAASGARFDVALAMEIIEHVADVDLFLDSCAKLVKPGGLLFVATLNRTLRAYALAIVGAEYILGWLPKGTHDWNKFIRPDELTAGFRKAGLQPGAESGVVYDPLFDRWRLSKDMAVNYMIVANKPA